MGSLEGSGEQGGGISTRQGIQHTVGGIQASHTHQRRQRRLRAGRLPPNQLGGDTNSSEKLKTPHSLQRLLPNSTVFTQKKCQDDRGREGRRSGEKSACASG